MASDVVVCHRVDPTTRVLRWVRRCGVVFLFVLAGTTLGGAAQAFWTSGGVGVGSALTGTLNPPTNVMATSGFDSDMVSVSWDAATLSTGDPVVGYRVTRMPEEGGEPSPACGTSATTLTAQLGCADLGVPDGDYRYVVTAVVGGWTAESEASAPVTVFANVGAPSVSVSTNPSPNANGYNRASPVTLNITASDPDGVASITYTVNSGAPSTVNGSSASVSLSGHGTWTVTYSAVDTLGNRSPLGTRVVRIDLIAPAAPTAPVLTAASDTGVSSTDLITSDRSPTFTGTAEPGATVLFYNGGTQVGSTQAGLDGTYTATSTYVLDDGTWSVYARAVDPAGNVGPSSATTYFTVDGTAPAAPAAPTLATASDTGTRNNDRVTMDYTPTYSGTTPSGTAGVRLYRDAVEVGSSTASPAYNVTAVDLADGSYSMTLRGYDVAGNLSPASPIRSLTVDTVAPEAPAAPALTVASDTGASSTDNITNDITPTVTGGTEVSAVVRLYAGTVAVGTQNTGSTTYNVTSSALAEGGHVLSVTVTDLAGNLGPQSAGTTITIDTTGPEAPSAPVLTTASDSGTASDDRITNDATPTFTGTAPAGSTVTLYDGNAPTGELVVAADGSYTATTGTLPNGKRNITARSDPDIAGNVGVSPITEVTIDTVAPGIPPAPDLVLASDSGRSTTDNVTNDTTPTFNNNGGAGVVGVLLYADGVEVANGSAAPSYMVTTPELADGVHAITARVFDAAGNVSVSSATLSVSIDTAAPAAPSAPVVAAASDTGASSTDSVTSDPTPAVIGSNEGSAIVIVRSGSTVVGSRTTASTSYSVTTSMLADGNHSLTATATDVAGNVGPASSSTVVTIDTVAPTAPSAPVLTTSSDTGVSSVDRVTMDTTPTFTGTAPAGSRVTLHDGNTPTGATVVAGDGTWTATTGDLSDGSRTMTARTDPDLAGNVGVSGSVVVTVDTVAPTASITVDSTTNVRFRIAFGENVQGFTSSDLALSGTANPTTSTLTGSGPYFATVGGMDRTGSVIVTLGPAAVTDVAGNANAGTVSQTITYTDTAAPTLAINQFNTATGRRAFVAGTAGTAPGDPSTITVVLCASSETTCPSTNIRATLDVTVGPSGDWSVTSGTLSSTANLYARARATDLSGNTRVTPYSGPVTIN